MLTCPASQDCILAFTATSALVPPLANKLNCLRAFADLWAQFLNRLGALPFFAAMSSSEREAWLASHESPTELDISEFEGTEVEVLDWGESAFVEELEPAVLEQFQAGPQSAAAMRAAFPGKPGSVGLKGRHTLAFYLQYWQVVADVGQNDSIKIKL